MTVGITGAAGFLGWHVAARLHALGIETVAATRETFDDHAQLRSFAANASCVLHLAGVNRASSDEEIYDGNLALAARLVSALAEEGRSTPVLYSNSTHSTTNTVYGTAKRESADTLAAYCASAGVPFLNLILPHLFGEFGRPNYNSAVTTFAHCLAVGEEPEVVRNGSLELLHAQDVAQRMTIFAQEPAGGDEAMAGRRITVGEVWDRLQFFHRRYVLEKTIPSFADRFDLQLFNTLRSQLYRHGHYPVPLTVHADQRGGFAELCRADGLGQTSMSTSAPGISRGDHFHFDKIERFVVVDGEATISLRRVLTDEVVRFEVSGDSPVVIDMPPLVTHNIVNHSDRVITTMFWAGDHFDPQNPDTYVDTVEALA